MTEAYEAGNEGALEYLEKGFKNKNGKWVKRGIFGRVPAPEALPAVQERVEFNQGCSDFCEYMNRIDDDDTRCYCRRLEMEVFNKKKCPYYEDMLASLASLMLDDK